MKANDLRRAAETSEGAAGGPRRSGELLRRIRPF